MTDPRAGETAGSTALHFQAPPAPPPSDSEVEDGTDAEPVVDAASRAPGRSTAPRGELRMLKGARAAAAGMNISDAQIRAVLEDPQDVQPDPNQPTRTRLRRDGLVVTTGNDGMILRVTRRRGA